MSNSLLDVVLEQVGDLITAFWDDIIRVDLDMECVFQARSPQEQSPRTSPSTPSVNPQGPPQPSTLGNATLSPNTASSNALSSHASLRPSPSSSDAMFAPSQGPVAQRRGSAPALFSMPNTPIVSTSCPPASTSPQQTNIGGLTLPLANTQGSLHQQPRQQSCRRWYSHLRLKYGRSSGGVPNIEVSSPSRASEEQVAVSASIHPLVVYS